METSLFVFRTPHECTAFKNKDGGKRRVGFAAMVMKVSIVGTVVSAELKEGVHFLSAVWSEYRKGIFVTHSHFRESFTF